MKSILAPPTRLNAPQENHMKYQEIITLESGKRGGKPCIRGLRITVYDVLSQLAAGITDTEILEDYPELNQQDIMACLAFAADREHRIEGIQAG
jgi:uncharacterized protein (DUF433 family)